jgi:hypothetical protein
LGDPVHHSLSPVMQNAALQAMGLDWVFLALPAPPTELATVVRGLEAMDCRGLNVTIPHKHSVAALTRELSPLALRLGAVNVLVPMAGGGWHGTNTRSSWRAGEPMPWRPFWRTARPGRHSCKRSAGPARAAASPTPSRRLIWW